MFLLLGVLACGSHEPAVETPDLPAVTPADETDPAGPDTWTTAKVDVPAQGKASARVKAVRAGSHEGFDRIVLEFEGDQLPGHRVAYVDPPAADCTAGAPLDIEGGGLLSVQVRLATAHDDNGASTAPREVKPGLPVVRELERSCDFEGVVAYVAGVAAPTPFRVFELREPPRLVVDVKR